MTDAPADTAPVEDEPDDGEPAASEPDDSDTATMSIVDAWSRQPADGQSTSAAYGIVSNPGDVDVTIVSASSPVTDQVELHETLVGDDGTMSMVERAEGFVVPAGGEFVFEPGGPHVMFLGIDSSAYPDEVEVTLEFDGAAPLTFMAEVRSLDGSMGEMDHGEMDHGEMDHGEMDHDEMDHDEMDHDEMDHDEHGDTDLDVSALHELDDQLANGALDAMAQRMVVGDYIAAVSAMEPSAESAEAQLLSLLEQLDAALEAGDLEIAASLAAEAHDVAHDMGHGHG
ncbi:MAG: copper chaperone PCu(A)C [Ilumatobacter sp.]|uniref:copper chaperone PCu(A)C n=1 Tax=Ilumatobacter sp. TaxID=1967498 RepID=UPI00391D6FD5